MSTEVVVVETGVANVASVRTGLRRAGAEPVPAASADSVRNASHVVVPGVGAFAPAMDSLEQRGLGEAVVARVREGRPTLGICLGMQLFCSRSDESPYRQGLGLVDGKMTRFGDGVRVPHLGWNRVEPDARSRYLEPGYAYFAHSYRLDAVPDGWSASLTDYGGSFVSALERGGVLACQFHPELSAEWGTRLLASWLERSVDAGEKSC